MRTLLALAFVAATASAASAGTYLGLGLGTAANMGTTSDSGVMAQGNGRSGRLMLGMGFGRLAIEGAASRYSLFLNSSPFDSTQLSASLKYSLPLGDNFEVFGRAGLERSYLTTTAAQSFNASGDGYLLGAGFEYKLNLGVAGGSVFVDYERASTSFVNDAMTKYDTTAGMWTAGVTLAL
jgi:hypothetical protein